MKCKLSKLFFLVLIGAVSVKGFSQTPAERKKITESYDVKKITELAQKYKIENEADYARALKIAEENDLPIRGTHPDGTYFELKGVDQVSGKLKYYQAFNNGATNSSVQTSRSNHLYSGGSLGINIQGQGMIVGIWDGGQPQASHANLGIERVTNMDNAPVGDQDGIDHATHVAGTMIGSGSGNINARGIAFNAYLWANKWDNDIAEMGLQATQGLLVSNHSYGIGNSIYVNQPGVFGRYNQSSRSLDAMMFLAEKYLPVFAAGNDRDGVAGAPPGTLLNIEKNGIDQLKDEAVAKNAVVVAAINGITDYVSATDAVMSSFSQWGPTDDFRVKPDISMKGVGVFSSNMPNASSVNSYASYPGTSMAAPGVTGVFALWQQYFKQLWPSKVSMRSASVRALMAHTAMEAGDTAGPDPKFGWGVINAEGGAKVLKDAKDNMAVFKEIELISGQTYELTVGLDGTAPLVATIAWLDKEGSVVNSTDSTVPVLVNDLDLRVERPTGQIVFPWSLNKSYSELWAVNTVDNNVDNIEKIEYKGLATGLAGAGNYVVRVTHKGNVLDSGVQKFTLIVSGGVVSFDEDPLSVDKFKFENLKIYPNPATDLINISSDIETIENAKVTIYDMLGKKVYENASLFDFNSDASIDVSSFNTGVYLVEILKDNKIDTRKVVIK